MPRSPSALNFQVLLDLFLSLLSFLRWTVLSIVKVSDGNEILLDTFYRLADYADDLRFYDYVLKNLDGRIKRTEQLLQYF